MENLGCQKPKRGWSAALLRAERVRQAHGLLSAGIPCPGACGDAGWITGATAREGGKLMTSSRSKGADGANREGR